MGMSLQWSRFSDLSELVEFVNLAYRGDYSFFFSGNRTSREELTGGQYGQSEAFCLCLEDEWVGVFVLTIVKEWDSERGEEVTVGYINMLCVHPEHRNAGHGTRLVKKAEDEARARSCVKLKACVMPLVPAVRYWWTGKQGYRLTGRVSAFPEELLPFVKEEFHPPPTFLKETELQDAQKQKQEGKQEEKEVQKHASLESGRRMLSVEKMPETFVYFADIERSLCIDRPMAV
uniref:N-acetyltransferase domain-containing protein n=1 Tax=Chromera velia CCMP2878 TaxID=1169474 RepID=A0A0G4FWQ5_9ALVE|mmetsp:Transcript_47489/g.93641  ORF Transcript_47489/g.93641 Transcript_47489/m.93641 type:complete len:232 (-) Transcript_47489:358-1053(-)|eukprot:Cvel_3840.t1-p1 / transcript=Cvel_3840.t1 / gene=Cvel_3840 / organism=Chromera_velia_CCMP2878 / gene_product=hypothetical protein / transcript_product=hypothetical protein / location=Cvel_scaffold162:76187-76879(+) / protein_length=231 / sequence_SO=supercontig / SO=protein_coding / is_pseudo=false